MPAILRFAVLFTVLSVTWFACAPLAHAQHTLAAPSTTTFATSVLEHIQAIQLDDQILEAAKKLFWSLAVMSLVWTMGALILRQDIGELLMELIRFMVVTGTFYWLLINASDAEGGGSFVKAIIDTFFSLPLDGSAEKTMKANANGFIGGGFQIFHSVVNDIKEVDTGDKILGGVLAIMVFVALLVLATQFLLVMTMAWLLGYAGIFLLGFGGARWTAPVAVSYYKHVVAVGIAIVSLHVIGAAGTSLFDAFGDPSRFRSVSTYSYLGMALAASVVMLVLSIRIPQLLYTLVTGSQLGFLSGAATMAGSAIATGGGAALAAALGRGPGGSGPHGSGGPSSVMEAVSRASASSASGDAFHVASGTDPFGVPRRADPYRSHGVFGSPPASVAPAVAPDVERQTSRRSSMAEGGERAGHVARPDYEKEMTEIAERRGQATSATGAGNAVPRAEADGVRASQVEESTGPFPSDSSVAVASRTRQSIHGTDVPSTQEPLQQHGDRESVNPSDQWIADAAGDGSRRETTADHVPGGHPILRSEHGLEDGDVTATSPAHVLASPAVDGTSPGPAMGTPVPEEPNTLSERPVSPQLTTQVAPTHHAQASVNGNMVSENVPQVQSEPLAQARASVSSPKGNEASHTADQAIPTRDVVTDTSFGAITADDTQHHRHAVLSEHGVADIDAAASSTAHAPISSDVDAISMEPATGMPVREELSTMVDHSVSPQLTTQVAPTHHAQAGVNEGTVLESAPQVQSVPLARARASASSPERSEASHAMDRATSTAGVATGTSFGATTADDTQHHHAVLPEHGVADIDAAAPSTVHVPTSPDVDPQLASKPAASKRARANLNEDMISEGTVQAQPAPLAQARASASSPENHDGQYAMGRPNQSSVPSLATGKNIPVNTLANDMEAPVLGAAHTEACPAAERIEGTQPGAVPHDTKRDTSAAIHDQPTPPDTIA